MPSVLFVCTGNICRSPMAVALFTRLVRPVPNRPPWRIESAGTWAMDGLPATENGQIVMKTLSLDTSKHRSRRVTKEMLAAFDLILTMEAGHKEALQIEFPGSAGRIHMLSEMVNKKMDIADPIGSPLEDYEDTARELDHMLSLGFKKIISLAEKGERADQIQGKSLFERGPVKPALPAASSHFMTQNPTRLAHPREAFGLVLLLALVHGLIYVFLIPPWQHYDEPNHFEYVWLAANQAALPQPGDYDLAMRREVAASMIANGFFSPGENLPDLDAVDKPAWIGPFPQLADPPVYYLLAGLPLRLLPAMGTDAQLYSARLVSLGFYLLSILAAFGVGRTLFAPDNPARWLGPLTMALLPGFTDLMTAVNNDAGGVAFFSLFIWGAVALIGRGFSWPRFLGSGAAALLCFWTKSALVIVFPLWALALLLALVRGPLRRRLWLAFLGGGVAVVIATLSWSDAAHWYRATAQLLPTRFEGPAAPVGTHGLQLQASAPTTPGWIRPLSQPLPVQLVQDLAGKTVTLGAWMWANQPVEASTPRLHTGGNSYQEAVSLSLTPAFFAFSANLAENDFRAWVTLDAPRNASLPDLQIYYDGLVLAAGSRPVEQPPQVSDPTGQEGQWGGSPFVNLLRNGSAERVWPSFQPWVDNLGARVLPDQSRLSMILYSILDPSAAGWYYQAAGSRLLRTFWAKFGWGHVPLLGHKPYRWLFIISLIGFVGASLGFWRKRHVLSGDVLGWLFLLTWGIWGAALARGSIYIPFERVFLPVARYAFPAIIPTVYFLTFGWLEVLRRIGSRFRIPLHIQYGIYLAGFLGLDVASIISITSYYIAR